MNEAQRQFVLGVAGVRVWYARRPLPAAAPSPHYEFPETLAQEPSIASPVARTDAPSFRASTRKPAAPGSAVAPGKLAELQSLLASKDTLEAAAVVAPATPERPSVAVEVPVEPAPVGRSPTMPDQAPAEVEASADHPPRGELVAIHWGFWRAGPWLLVSALKEGASRDLEARLAQGILAALGECEATSVQVRWPVFSNAAVPGGDAGGLADVFLRVIESGGQPEKVLCLGVLPAEDSPERATLESLLAILGTVVIQGEVSLAGLASQPQEKKTLWTALRPHKSKSITR